VSGSLERAVKHRTDPSIRFFSADNLPLLTLAVIVLLLAFGGVKLGERVGTNLLRGDGEDTTAAWAASLLGSAVDLPAVAQGAEPSDDTRHLLRDAILTGDIYRYQIWDRSGRLVLGFERLASAPVSGTLAERRGQAEADRILSGHGFTETHQEGSSENPPYFAISFIPIRQNGVVVGAFEVYLDQSADFELYHGSLRITECIIAIAVLLAGGLPSFMVHRKMLAYRKAQAETLFLAEHDGLTGIANRGRLQSAFQDAIGWNRRNETCIAALLIDLDRFKEINDGFGHGAGDRVLKEVAARLRASIRQEDVAGRLGGDEFAILQVGIDQPTGAVALTDRLMAVLSQPYEIDGLKIACGASIGVAVAPTDAQDWESLLGCADAALYKAKFDGRNSVRFFEPGMDAILRERRRIELDLRRALDTNAFHLAYQPLFSFHDGSLLGFEALLRWPEGWESCSPAQFIPVAEESGLIVPIGAWVLREACRAAAAWSKPLRVAVNLSPVQFRHGELVGAVSAALQESGLDPARLELEVTESLWLQNADLVLDQLTRLRGMGISIALDDFGTGYSCLSYLWKFPFDTVKIDRSFVSEMERDAKATAIIGTIVALGRSLALTVTAEGVESPAQAAALTRVGCDQAQGYLFGFPLSARSANALVDAKTSLDSLVCPLHPHPAD
jgi:diguanylate cyclase (GGDEF)-like protein